MYWGSKYCSGCKHNRDCYMVGNNGSFIILNKVLENLFKERYEEENKRSYR